MHMCVGALLAVVFFVCILGCLIGVFFTSLATAEIPRRSFTLKSFSYRCTGTLVPTAGLHPIGIFCVVENTK